MAHRKSVHVLISRIPVAIRVAVVLLGVGLCTVSSTPAQAQAKVQVFQSFGSQGAPATLAKDAWVKVALTPHADTKIEVKEGSWLRVSMGRYGHGCRACRCFSTVWVKQAGRVLEMDLARVVDDSRGLCRAMSRVGGSAVIGPLEPGVWTLQGVHRDDVHIQVDPG